MSEQETHVCKKCGLLALRDANTNEPIEADEKFRSEGVQRYGYMGTKSRFPRLLCRAGEREFEFPKRADFPDVIEKISEEIPCKSFEEYRPGVSPQEMEKMSLSKLLDERTEKWRTEDVAWRRSVERSIDRRFQWTIALAVLALVVSIIGIIVSVLNAM